MMQIERPGGTMSTMSTYYIGMGCTFHERNSNLVRFLGVYLSREKFESCMIGSVLKGVSCTERNIMPEEA